MDLAALRIDAIEDAFDGAVLAGCIHALKDQQQRPAILRVEFLLKIAQGLAVGVENLLGLVLVEAALLVGLVRFEMELARSVEAKRRDKGLQLIAERWRGFLAHEVGSSGWQQTVHGEGVRRQTSPFAPSFRDGPKDQTRNLEIPGSLALLAPRNDSLRGKLLLDKRRDKARHRRREIGNPAHQMDRGQFRLMLAG